MRHTVPLNHDQSIEITLSSAADRPAVWFTIVGGESLDPSDPDRLRRLPVANYVHMDADDVRALRTALIDVIAELEKEERENGDAYLEEDWT